MNIMLPFVKKLVFSEEAAANYKYCLTECLVLKNHVLAI